MLVLILMAYIYLSQSSPLDDCPKMACVKETSTPSKTVKNAVHQMVFDKAV